MVGWWDGELCSKNSVTLLMFYTYSGNDGFPFATGLQHLLHGLCWTLSDVYPVRPTQVVKTRRSLRLLKN